MKLIKNIFRFFSNLIQNYRVKKITKKLKTAATSKHKERLKLKYEVMLYIRKFRNMDKDNVSKYIPWTEKTKELVRFNIDEKFGKEMNRLNVRLNKKMQVV